MTDSHNTAKSSSEVLAARRTTPGALVASIILSLVAALIGAMSVCFTSQSLMRGVYAASPVTCPPGFFKALDDSCISKNSDPI